MGLCQFAPARQFYAGMRKNTVKHVFAVSPLESKPAGPQSDLTTTPMPVRLSFLTTPNSGRVLTHVAPNGGTAFSHTLLDVPAGTDAHTAIQTWGSPHWQRHEPGEGHTLPELSFTTNR
jgi:hypothetical protein